MSADQKVKGPTLISSFGLLEPPLYQGFLHMPDGSAVKAPSALFDKRVKVLARDVIVATQMALAMVAEILFR